MKKFVIIAAVLGCCLSMPQGHSGQVVGDPFVRILELESYQNGADFGHSLKQEDGIASGQKVAPDGLVYGFYSYVQDDGNTIKVYYRAGKGVGYEVLKVEGLNEKDLGNLKPTISKTPVEPEVIERRPIVRQPVHVQSVQAPVVRQPVQIPVVQQPVHVQPVHIPVVRQPVPVHPILPLINPLIPVEPTPAPHRFDYPANLNLQRTGTGFRSSFKAL